jgi:glycosyltransferase involved in cell wall biosynthesis
MTGLTIIIPIYNEELSIVKTVSLIKTQLEVLGVDWEILCINDGSNDNSREVLDKMSGIKVIHHRVNKGYGAALKTGLRKALYDDICITDADGTYPNDRIAEMYQWYMQNELDMLVGARKGDDVFYPLIKRIPKFFINKLANYITNTKIPDINSGMRIFKRQAAMEYFHIYPNGFSFTTTITIGMLCSEYNVEYFNIDYFKRQGKSKIKPISDTINFFKLLLKIALYFDPFKFFKPLIYVFGLLSILFLFRDIFILHDLTQGSIFFPVIAILFFSLGLLADLIIKRSKSTH